MLNKYQRTRWEGDGDELDAGTKKVDCGLLTGQWII